LFELPGSFWTSAFGSSKSQKALGSQKPEAHYSELLGFWLMGAVWLLESPKASSLKVPKSSNKQGHNLEEISGQRCASKAMQSQISSIFGRRDYLTASL